MSEATATVAAPPVSETKPQPPPSVSFDRLPGETAKAFAAFRTYLKMGPDRSTRKTGRKLAKNRTTIGEWSVKYCWTERAAAYDAAQAAKEQSAIDDQQRRDAQKWADRLNQHRERRFRLGTLMLNTAEKLLKGKKKPDPAAADRLAKVGDMLIGLSTGAPTANLNVGSNEESGAIPIVASVGTVNVFLPEKEPLPDEAIKAA